jgi:plasmid stabilization system protein ParE
MKVRWSETAFGEIESIFSFFFERSRSAAAAVARRILDRSVMLGDFPYAGHITDVPGVRALSVVTYPFVDFYSIDNVSGEVFILNVRHPAQAPDQPR